ncbi:MAG: hypothetical protein KDK90_28095 [Leptospiraceae bacterium]|nr:hypothetical protein [Leptospiraceae bacterium]
METDEDKLMKRLKVHRDVIGKIIKILQKEGIKCERTYDNDSSGDILYYDAKYDKRVKEIVREWNKTKKLE